MSKMSNRRLGTGLLAVMLAGSVVVASCSSDKDGSTGDAKAASSTTTPATSTTAAAGPKPVTVLVSNDDGYEAPGIDALVEGLRKLPQVKVVVYAPLKQQSGTAGKTTDGPVEVTDVKLHSGAPAKAVAGFPADTIKVAMDRDGVKPDLVVTGINLGQNIGPLVDVSGTVGAARAAVARGVPALATSSGLTAFDVKAAVPFVVDWFEKNRAAVADHSLPVAVQNLNVPSCETGKVRGLADVKVGLDEPAGDALKTQDCNSTAPEASLVDDVQAFNAGFATLSTLSAEPAIVP